MGGVISQGAKEPGANKPASNWQRIKKPQFWTDMCPLDILARVKIAGMVHFSEWFIFSGKIGVGYVEGAARLSK